MADSVVQGLSADPSRIPSKWNRNTVADGDWLQFKTLDKLSARDVYLASAIDTSTQDWKDAVEAEETRATAAEEALDRKIEQETSDRITDVDNEETRAKEAETVLQNAITDETNRATREETRIENLIVQEQTRAQEAEGNLYTKIETEITNREEADRALAEDIEGLKAATDVISVFGTYAQFVNGSADLHATDKDFIKVLADESRNNVQTYYQSTVTTDTTEPATEDEEPVTTTTTSWAYVTALPPYYDTSTIDGKFNDISATVSSTYLSANDAVFGSTNIKVVPDANDPKITIETYPDVTFTTVTSVGFSGTNISGASKNDSIDNLFGSAYSGAAASAWVSANSAHLDIQAGYGLETGEDNVGHLVIGLHQDHCDYYGHSLALGSYSTANGDNSYAFGMSCVTNGSNALAIGDNARATTGAIALGTYNSAMGKYSLALGYDTSAFNQFSVAIGRGLSGEAPITLGTWNDNVAGATFIIGDGTGTQEGFDVVRKNALVIKDGLVSGRDFSAGNVSLSSLTNLSAFGNGITNTATFNLSAVKLSAGQGIGFKNDTNGVLSITAEGTTYQAGDYISTANKTIAVTGNLITSANAGSAASAWINSNKSTIAYTTNFNGTSNVITGYGTSSFAGGISSISVLGSVFTGRNVNLYDSNNIDFTTANNSLTIDLNNNITLGESETKQVLILTENDDEVVIGADGPVIAINNTSQSQLQLFNNKIIRDGKNTTWDKVISASNGNFVSAANNQTLTLASATTAITPSTMSNNIIYLV